MDVCIYGSFEVTLGLGPYLSVHSVFLEGKLSNIMLKDYICDRIWSGVGVQPSPRDAHAEESVIEMYGLGVERDSVQVLTCAKYLQLGRSMMGDGAGK